MSCQFNSLILFLFFETSKANGGSSFFFPHLPFFLFPPNFQTYWLSSLFKFNHVIGLAPSHKKKKKKKRKKRVIALANRLYS